MDINTFAITGRVSRDIEIRQTNSDNPVGNFSIAVNRTRRVNGNVEQRASFFDCVVWGNYSVAIAKYLVKGARLAVSGYMQQNSWTQEDGSRRYKIELIVERIQLLDPVPQPAQ